MSTEYRIKDSSVDLRTIYLFLFCAWKIFSDRNNKEHVGRIRILFPTNLWRKSLPR